MEVRFAYKGQVLVIGDKAWDLGLGIDVVYDDVRYTWERPTDDV